MSDLNDEQRPFELRAEDLNPDPIQQFQQWFQEAGDRGVPTPEAMTLATASPDGHPSARIVLLRGCDSRGFVFYTNYESRKGRELEVNPHAALVFHWDSLERQVRVEGRVERVSSEESDAYFGSRPPGSQLGAWASPQSAVLADRLLLEERCLEFEKTFRAGPVPRPRHWGGYRVLPETIEFWQGRPSRLHDRFRYIRQPSNWRIERLAP